MARPDALRRRSSSRHVKRSRLNNSTVPTLFEDEDAVERIIPKPRSNSSKVQIWGLDTDGGHDYLVEFADEHDPTNPLNWPSSRKWTIVAILSLAGFLGNLGTVMCIPSIPQILGHFDSTSTLYGTSLVSAWEIGEAIGPLFVAPMSEIFGRAPVYNATNVWFVLLALASGASRNLDMLVAFRLLNGMGDSSQSLNAGIVGDMFAQQRRGLAVALTCFPPMLGPVAGPVIGGYLTEALGWRWSFWLCAILGGACTITFAAFYRESYRPTILRAKAERLRRQTGKKAYHSGVTNAPSTIISTREGSMSQYQTNEDDSKFDFDASTTRTKLYLKSITRPIRMLVKLPVVWMLSIYMSVQFGLLYVILATATDTMETMYDFSQGEAGLSFLAVSTGMILGVAVCALTLDPLLKRQQKRHSSSKPEARFPPTLVGAIGTPIGILVYGWGAQYSSHWIMPLLGTSIVGFSFYLASVPLQAYLVDAYTIYSASAIAATVACRCIAGALLPLAGPPLYQKLGLGEGSTVLAVIGIIAIPLPIYVMRYGERIRWHDDIPTVE